MKRILNPYYVDFISTCTHSEHEDVQYGSWSEEHENSFGAITCKSSHPNLASELKLKKGDKAFLVWIEYSSGDSFGHNTRGHVLPIALFKDIKSARALQADTKFWKPEHDPTNIESSRQCRFKSPCGQLITRSYPEWDDYFGGLDEVHVEEVTIS